MPNMLTRQLPMGAGHCQWGVLTNRNKCNIYGGAHLASRYHAMLWPGTFVIFGTLPATLATCQHLETCLEEASCRSLTLGKLPKLVGMLPIVPHLTPPVLNNPTHGTYDQNRPRKGIFSWIFDLDL